jgi:hypothetical protein
MKKFMEWLEGDISRGRRVVLMSTILVFLLITIGIFGAAAWGVKMSTMIPSLYVTLVGLIAAIYGFYTGTSSDKSAKLADKAADIMLKNIEKMQKKAAEEPKEEK